MEIRVQLFGGCVEAADGRREIQVPLTVDTPTVLDLREAVVEHYPKLAAIMRRSRIAVGKRFASESDKITEADEVVLIPPVSGG